jgi:hypothetical protein
MDYYNDYCIDNFDVLLSKLDNQNTLNQDVNIRGDFFSLSQLETVNGHLNLSNDNLKDLGELTYVKTDLWINNPNSKLLSLKNLKSIGGNLSLRYSNVIELGELVSVGGNVNLRDTPVIDLGKLKYVGGNLFLPKRLENMSLEGIEIKGNVRYWNDKKESKVEQLIEELDWGWDNFFSEIHVKEIETKQKILNVEYLLKRCFNLSNYNQYIIENLRDFISFVDSELSSLYNDRYSFYHSLYDELKTLDEINKEFPTIKVDKRIKRDERFRTLKQLSNTFLSQNKSQFPIIKYERVIKGFKNNDDWNGGKTNLWLKYDEHILGKSESCCKFEWNPYKGENIFEEGFIHYVENKLLETFSIFVDSLQNKFRLSRGISRIGEGWVSETDLYYKLKDYFNFTTVIHHGKTKWLGKQHIDIWFPKFKIGIEYQGEQHDRPIEFFGGENNFIKNQERDDRKRKLFEINDSFLIEVRPNYSLVDLVKEIEELILKL